MASKPSHPGVSATARPFALALGLLLLGPLQPPSSALAAPQKAPNTRISIDLPASYEPADLFAGFVDETTGVSIVITEMPPAAYQTLAAGFTPETLGRRGIENVARGELARAGEYVYVRGSQSSPSGDYAKFFVAFPTTELTALITANVPRAALDKGEVKPAEIEGILASARAEASMAAAREQFRLGHLGPFKQAGSLMGTSRIFTLDGKLGGEGGPKVFFFVAPSIDRRPVADLEGFSSKALADLDAVRDAEVEGRRRLALSGSDALEIVARARDREGAELAVYQLVVKGKAGSHFRMVGLAPAVEAPRYLPEFRRMAESFAERE